MSRNVDDTYPLEEVRKRLDLLRIHLGCGDAAAQDLEEVGRLLDLARHELDRREAALASAQREGRRAASDYHELFELAPDGYVVTDLEGIILEANRVAHTLLGPELRGVEIESFVSSSQSRTFEARVRGLHSGRAARIQDWQLVLQPPDQAALQAEVTVEPRRDDTTKVIIGLRWMIRDVTERQRAAEALRESEARFRAIYENAAVGIRVVDIAEGGRIVQANQAYQDMMGYDEDELRGRTFFDVTHPDDLSANRDLYESLIRGEQEQFQVEKRYVRKDGSHFWARLTVSPVLDRSGHPVYLIGVVEDISERKRAERDLKDSLARTQALLDASIDGIVTIDELGHIESVNPATERLSGYPPSELVGRNVNILVPAPWKGEHDDYLRVYRETGKARIIGIGREVFCERKDGTRFPAELAVSEVELGDRRIFMGTIRDITERKETDEALRKQRDFAESLVETARAIVLVLDPEGRILLFNRYMESVSGYSLEDLRGDDWFDRFIPPDERQELRELFIQAIAPGIDLSNVNRILCRDGTERIIDWQTTTLLDSRGEVTGVLSIGQDITERQRLEEQFRQAQKMEAIGRLAGGIAHDFNTLLGSCMGYNELLLQRLDRASEEHRLAEQVHRTTQRGAALTRQLLTFSRRQRTEIRPLDPAQVLTDLEDMLQRLLGEDVLVEFDLGREVGLVDADRTQLEQVIVNLAVNAGDAMPRGGRLSIELLQGESDSEGAGSDPPTVRLIVSDTGHGMDDATRERVFEPFFTTKEVGKGTGLGLSTVYAIVEQTGGTIRVDSLPGAGTTFHIDLPRSRNPLSAPEEAAEVAEEESPAASGETVLVVEDDEMFRSLIREVLEGAGYLVMTAVAPAQALELLEAEGTSVDLVLTDLVMPGMTGRELAEAVHDRWPRLRIVFMSGYSGDELERRQVEARDEPFLRKPFGTKALLQAIRAGLDSGTS